MSKGEKKKVQNPLKYKANTCGMTFCLTQTQKQCNVEETFLILYTFCFCYTDFATCACNTAIKNQLYCIQIVKLRKMI